MTHKQFLKEFRKEVEFECQTTAKKNADYADESDAFSNFTSGEVFGMNTAKGIFTRMIDKMKRTSRGLNGHTYKVRDEKIGDDLTDLAVYAKILKIYLRSK
jgi:hypothetical protein